MVMRSVGTIRQGFQRSVIPFFPAINILTVGFVSYCRFGYSIFFGIFNDVGLSNILYSERFKESSKFFFRREPSKRAHR